MSYKFVKWAKFYHFRWPNFIKSFSFSRIGSLACQFILARACGFPLPDYWPSKNVINNCKLSDKPKKKKKFCIKYPVYTFMTLSWAFCCAAITNGQLPHSMNFFTEKYDCYFQNTFDLTLTLKRSVWTSLIFMWITESYIVCNGAFIKCQCFINSRDGQEPNYNFIANKAFSVWFFKWRYTCTRAIAFKWNGMAHWIGDN